MLRLGVRLIRQNAINQKPRKTAAMTALLPPSSVQRHQCFHSTAKLREASEQISKTPITKITPKYQITFTCKACDARTTHQMTKQAYTKGTVLIQCPSCKNRHLIADNLKIFSDTNINIEDILREKGESIEKGNVHEGDLEFLPDDATTSEEQKALS